MKDGRGTMAFCGSDFHAAPVSAGEDREWTLYVCPTCGNSALDAGQSRSVCYGWPEKHPGVDRQPVTVVEASPGRGQ